MNSDGTVEAILEMQGVHWATQSKTVESVLGRRKGVVAVQANPVAQTATVRFDPTLTTPADLRNGSENADTTAQVSPSRTISATLCSFPPLQKIGPAPVTLLNPQWVTTT